MSTKRNEGGRPQRGRANGLMTLATLASAVLLLQACGGGGDGAGTSAASPTPTQSGTEDYYTYANVTTTNGVAGPTYYRTYAVRTNTDSSTDRIVTSSAFSAEQRLQTSGGALSSITQLSAGNPTSTCTYSPAAQFVPPSPRSVGQTWSQSWTLSCTSGSTSSGTQNGSIAAIEDVVLPFATLSSYRAVRTSTVTSGTTTSQTQETCWYPTNAGFTTRCTTVVTNSAPSAPTQTTSTETTLIGYGGPNREPQGNRIARFAGSWRVTFGGSFAGTCSAISVTATGNLSGACSGTGGAFTVSGTIDSNGSLQAVATTGSRFAGTIGTPHSGSGTWTDVNGSGTWTAVHN
jgi:hypothetical protein